jgi:hypothetical protein
MTTYLVKVLGVTNEAANGSRRLPGSERIEVKNVLDIGKAVVQLCEPGASPTASIPSPLATASTSSP